MPQPPAQWPMILKITLKFFNYDDINKLHCFYLYKVLIRIFPYSYAWHSITITMPTTSSENSERHHEQRHMVHFDYVQLLGKGGSH